MFPLLHGLVDGARVGDVLAGALRLCEPGWTSVIRCIDSDRSRNTLERSLAFHRVRYEIVDGNVCVSLDALWEGLSDGLFTGFDEVWILRSERAGFDLACAPCATSDGADFSLRAPDELGMAMDQADCALVLGDGCGLNYAAIDERFLEAILETEKDDQRPGE